MANFPFPNEKPLSIDEAIDDLLRERGVTA